MNGRFFRPVQSLWPSPRPSISSTFNFAEKKVQTILPRSIPVSQSACLLVRNKTLRCQKSLRRNFAFSSIDSSYSSSSSSPFLSFPNSHLTILTDSTDRRAWSSLTLFGLLRRRARHVFAEGGDDLTFTTYIERTFCERIPFLFHMPLFCTATTSF